MSGCFIEKERSVLPRHLERIVCNFGISVCRERDQPVCSCVATPPGKNIIFVHHNVTRQQSRGRKDSLQWRGVIVREAAGRAAGVRDKRKQRGGSLINVYRYSAAQWNTL